MVALARKASLAGASRTGAGDGPDASCPLGVQAAEGLRANAPMGNTKGRVSFLVVLEQLVC